MEETRLVAGLCTLWRSAVVVVHTSNGVSFQRLMVGIVLGG
jgi:hypothetical protein